MKKRNLLLLSVLMILALAVFVSCGCESQNDVNGTISGEEATPTDTEPTKNFAILIGDTSANAGADDVKVAVSIENNPGFFTLALNIEYDESVMTLTKIANGPDFADYTFTKPKNTSSGCRATWLAADMPEKIVDGEILSLTFSISDTAAKGTYNVTVSGVNDGSNEFEFAAATGHIIVQ